MGNCANAEGSGTTAIGDQSHAEGNGTTAVGDQSHAEGSGTTAIGFNSHAEGVNTTAIGFGSHAGGVNTTASGVNSHAEGNLTEASGSASHAEGSGTKATGSQSHAEGLNTTASGHRSHAEGLNTTASGHQSHAEGEGTSTAGFVGSHIMGRFGDATEAYSWFIGNGTDNTNKGLGAKWIASTGNMSIDGSSYITSGADYAEMFEMYKEHIDVGFFVTLKGRKATTQDEFILGITSVTPSILGNSADLIWHGKYLLDRWGRRKIEERIVPEDTDSEGNVISPSRIEKSPVLNPKWNPNQLYQSRIERAEWVVVGLLGQIRVRDDGTCEVDGYCFPNQDGIATKSKKGYRVLERLDKDQILIFFR
ncbi:peptidase G2 autoproteolytic cleavage domain-containing protein [Bacillus pacificus]|uniref:peptidase G2 autoproteolytic cleavage domain-containing protein n=1 Tax=Bacillus pacificus TaxID=2026187 RepID=UPI003D1E97BF